LLNARGALLLLNDQAETEVFICESKKTLESYAQMARDNDAPLWVVEALQKHTHIPYLLGASNEDLPFDQWENFMLSATPIEDSDLFYAFVPADFGIPYDLQHKKIKNYALFIEEHLKQELDV
jgi:hypothetical protein